MTNEEYENLKKEFELLSLKNQIEKQKNELKPSLASVLFNQATKSISLIVAIVSMLAGIWGLVIPARNFFKDKQKEKHYELSRDMVELANNLQSDSVKLQQEAVLLLSYYDLNSMPILLYQLENFSNSVQKDMVDHVIKSISLIYMRNKSEVTSEIIYYFSNLFRQTDTEKKWDDLKYNSLLNYAELVNKITFREKDKRRIVSLIEDMQEKIEKDPGLKDKMQGFSDLIAEFK